MVERYPGEADLKAIRSHVHKFLYTGLKLHTDLRDKLSEAKSLDVVKETVQEMMTRRKDLPVQSKIGWYYRYWPSMSISKDTAPTFIFTDWDTQISVDPLFNKKKKSKEYKKEETVVNNDVLASGEIEMDLGNFLEGEDQ